MPEPKEMLELATVSGNPVWVEPDATIGPYAVHRAVGGMEGWSVTHITTGKKMWTTGTFQGAVRVATYLDNARTVPADVVGAEQWWAELTPPVHVRIVEALQNISPRIP